MFISSYFDREGWWVSPSRKTFLFRLWYNFSPMPFRMFVLTASGLGSSLAVSLTLPESIPWSMRAVFILVGSIGAPIAGKDHPSLKSIRKLEDQGLIARRDSYAFRRLEAHLAKYNFLFDAMEPLAYEVACIYIQFYLKEIAEGNRLIQEGHLQNGDEQNQVQLIALKRQIDEIAQEVAGIIHYDSTQRKLIEEAIKSGMTEAAKHLEEQRKERLAAVASGKAEIWLLNKGILD